jgi:tetratricopeptide (TPR) repeat protein
LIGYGYAGIGYCYAKTNDLEKAKDFVERAEDIAWKIDNENILYQVNKTYANIYMQEENWSDAEKYFQNNIELAEKSNETYSLYSSHYEFGLMYKEKDDLKNANKHLKIAQDLYHKLNIGETEANLNALGKK